MTKQGPTLGPWRADNLAKVRCEADDGKGLVAVAYGGRYYGSVPATKDDLETARANARLIVRAVNSHEDLLEALEAIAQYGEAHGGYVNAQIDGKPISVFARTAIAKATP